MRRHQGCGPRPLLASLLVALVAASCGPGAASPTPSVDPSLGPVIATDDAFCAAFDVLESEHLLLRRIRLRPSNRDALDEQYGQFQLAWEDVRRAAPPAMADHLSDMDWVVIELRLAVEDYTTTARFGEAAQHVLRKDIAMARAIARLRGRTTCGPWEPTPRPEITPTASPAASPSASPSPAASPSPPASPAAAVPGGQSSAAISSA